MKTRPILNMIPQYNLNLRLAHKDTLKEIYLRLARMIMLGNEIKDSYFQVIKDKQKEIYFFGDESGPISEETYGDIEPLKRREIKTRDVSSKELDFILEAQEILNEKQVSMKDRIVKRVLPGRVL